MFIDNYAAIPPESIRRLLALHRAGILRIVALGEDYDLQRESDRTLIVHHQQRCEFDVFIDARGQKALKTRDLPFPSLRQQLLTCGDAIPDVGDDYTLQAPEAVRPGRLRRPSPVDARSPLCPGADGQRRDWQRNGRAVSQQATAGGAVSGLSTSGTFKRNIRNKGAGRRAINSGCSPRARPRLTFTRYS